MATFPFAPILCNPLTRFYFPKNYVSLHTLLMRMQSESSFSQGSLHPANDQHWVAQTFGARPCWYTSVFKAFTFTAAKLPREAASRGQEDGSAGLHFMHSPLFSGIASAALRARGICEQMFWPASALTCIQCVQPWRCQCHEHVQIRRHHSWARMLA